MTFVRHVHFSFGFFDSSMPDSIRRHIDDVAAANPTYKITVWGPVQARQLFQQPQYAVYLPKYDAMAFGIQRSDMSRYAILHAHGGVYADLDYSFRAPLDEVLAAAFDDPATQVFVNETPNATLFKRRASNSFMGARAPGHPFWLAVLDTVHRGWGLSRHQRIMSAAGPQAVDRALARWRGPGVRMLPKEVFNPCSVCNRDALATSQRPHVLAVHNNGGSWHEPVSAVYNSLFCDWYWYVVVAVLAAAVVALAVALGLCGRRRGAKKSPASVT